MQRPRVQRMFQASPDPSGGVAQRHRGQGPAAPFPHSRIAMPRHVLLNNVDHRDLTVDTGHGAALGEAVMSAPTFPAEFRNVQSHYPIVFHRDGQGRYQPLALFGLRKGENLFLDGTRWDAAYVPLAMERQPFLIGGSGDGLAIHIDLDSPRVGNGKGQAVFLEHGGNTEFLERMRSILDTLHQGMRDTAAFVDSLQQHDLLESFVLDVELDDGSHNRLAGFHTINEERLGELDGATLQAWNRSGFLQAVYMAMASLSNFRGLIERMNAHVRAAGR